MREVANFMHMYPSYKLRDVLNEYAIVFYALLNEGYRQQYMNYKRLAEIANFPQMDKKEKQEFYQSLDWASTHPSDILKPSGEGSSPAEIKRLLKG